jgi:3-oxoacyl-[acyl-carrier protein] reductase
MAEQEVREFGSIDILVNNAGFTRDKYLLKMPVEDWDSVVDTILKGAYYCTRAALPSMMENRWGRVINIASRAHWGNPGQTNYSAAKAGLIGFTRSLALEQGKFNITANAIAPGLIETPLVRGLSTYETLRANALARQPVGRLGAVEDIADAVAFLASGRASFITGELLHVTGGRYAS